MSWIFFNWGRKHWNHTNVGINVWESGFQEFIPLYSPFKHTNTIGCCVILLYWFNLFFFVFFWRGGGGDYWLLLKIVVITFIFFLFAVHGVEYGFGAHDRDTTGIFEVEPGNCPGFTFRKSIYIGSTDLDAKDVREFMEKLADVYAGNTYHLIQKNCNHFCNDVCIRLTGKSIPRWVNRLARLGKSNVKVFLWWVIVFSSCLYFFT